MPRRRAESHDRDSVAVPRQFPFRNGEIKLEFVYPIGIFNARVSKALNSLEFKYFQCWADDLTGELAPGLLATCMLLFETRANFSALMGDYGNARTTENAGRPSGDEGQECRESALGGKLCRERRVREVNRSRTGTAIYGGGVNFAAEPGDR
jgi:hypothetical protein